MQGEGGFAQSFFPVCNSCSAHTLLVGRLLFSHIYEITQCRVSVNNFPAAVAEHLLEENIPCSKPKLFWLGAGHVVCFYISKEWAESTETASLLHTDSERWIIPDRHLLKGFVECSCQKPLPPACSWESRRCLGPCITQLLPQRGCACDLPRTKCDVRWKGL